jgi:hypothetical protein
VHPAADRLTSAVAVAVALDLRRRAERPTFATRRRSSAGDERSFRGGHPSDRLANTRLDLGCIAASRLS